MDGSQFICLPVDFFVCHLLLSDLGEVSSPSLTLSLLIYKMGIFLLSLWEDPARLVRQILYKETRRARLGLEELSVLDPPSPGATHLIC